MHFNVPPSYILPHFLTTLQAYQHSPSWMWAFFTCPANKKQAYACDPGLLNWYPLISEQFNGVKTQTKNSVKRQGIFFDNPRPSPPRFPSVPILGSWWQEPKKEEGVVSVNIQWTGPRTSIPSPTVHYLQTEEDYQPFHRNLGELIPYEGVGEGVFSFPNPYVD